MTRWKEFGLLFGVQFVQYRIFCLSIIVVSRGNYLLTVATDTIYGLNSFFLIKRIAKLDSSNGWGLAGFTLGGTCGSLAAIWITKRMGV